MTRVVNLRDYRGKALPAGTIRVDRKSRWGNPFVIGAQDPCMPRPYKMRREHVIAHYGWWLDDRLSSDSAFLDDLRDAEAVACWCAPEPCHGDIIVARLAAASGPFTPEKPGVAA